MSNTLDSDFDNQTTFRIGVEFEFVLPITKNKWSVILEPTFQYFKGESNSEGSPEGILIIQETEVEYKSIEVPLGVRHYFFLDNDSKFFINGAMIFDIPFGHVVSYRYPPGLEVVTRNTNYGGEPNFSLAFGVGYKYKNKYSIELRHQSTRDLLHKEPRQKAEYQTPFSLILGYTLF